MFIVIKIDDTFEEAKLTVVTALSLAVTAILEAPAENKLQPCKIV